MQRLYDLIVVRKKKIERNLFEIEERRKKVAFELNEIKYSQDLNQ